MKLSRERKAYAGMLVLGLLALGADRFIIGSPSSAGADEYTGGPENVPAMADDADAAPPAEPAGPAPRTEVVSLGQRLRQFGAGGEQPMVDLFQLPAAWRPTGPEPLVARPAQRSSLSPAELFKRRKLTGVLVETTGLGRRQAIVDGHAILLGHSLDGFRLVAVTQKTAVFEGDGQQVVLQAVEQP
jgi:hypothetical protein